MRTSLEFLLRAPGRRLTVVYVASLCSIGALLVTNAVLMQVSLARQRVDAAAMHMAGEQIVRSDNLQFLSLALATSTTGTEREERIAALRHTLDDWERTRRGLKEGDAELGLAGASDPELLRLFAEIEPHYAAMSAAVSSILQRAETHPAPADSGAIERLRTARRAAYPIAEAIVAEYGRLAAGRAGHFSRIEFALTIAGLGILLLTGVAVFRRTVKKAGAAVAELQRTHDALEESQARTVAIVEAALDAIVTMDQDGRVVEFNPAAESTFGYRRSEALGQPLGDLIIPALRREAHESGLARHLASGNSAVLGRRIETVGLRKSGVEFPMELAIARTDRGGSPLFTAYIRDITARRHAEDALKEEAEIAGAMARVGREMIARMGTGDLLNRLCRLTAEAIGCDFSHTWLWQPDEEVTVAVAGYGDPPDQWEQIRLLKVPRTRIGPPADADVWQELTEESLDPNYVSIVRHYGITRVLYMALRRRGEIVGVLNAGDRGATGSFSPRQFRIANGIAQIASLAIEHARLVDELEAANRVKSNFVAAMSHELRRSFAVIIGYIDLLLNGEFGTLTPEGSETLRKVAKSGWESLDVIKATLDLSRAESRPVPLNITDTSVPRILGELQADAEVRWAKPELRIVWNVPGDIPLVRTDPVKLKMILNNLIGNAVKYTRRGTVTVTAQSDRGGVRFSVSDTGDGIPAEALPMIFEPFQQASTSRTSPYEGVGLGLYIVRRLLDTLGGSIEVESRHGEGSTFHAWIPFQISAPEGTAAPRREDSPSPQFPNTEAEAWPRI